jgi:hypothetical protein
MTAPLRELALASGTDKEGAHHYALPYEAHLAKLRERPVRLLEIGIGGGTDPEAGGASLRMWKAYFPRGMVFGLDLHDKSRCAEERITVLQGDQGDVALLERIGAEHGPFDVIIDDGSHLSADVITSFQALFPFVTEDGVYVIEDLQTAYWETYQVGPSSSKTSMELLKDLLDGLNYSEFDIPGYRPSYFDQWITSICVYHNIAFIQKGPNVEPSNALDPHPRSERIFARPGRRASARARVERHARKGWRAVRSGVQDTIRGVRHHLP